MARSGSAATGGSRIGIVTLPRGLGNVASARRPRIPGALQRGKTVCTNALVVPTQSVDDAVLAALTPALRPAMARAILNEAMAAVQPETVTANVRGLRKELQALDA